jgi:putative addiction module component (TIGR02574 family)
MDQNIAAIVAEAERLPAAERIRLVEQLLVTLDKPDLDIDTAWVVESERRLDAYLAGGAEAVDAADVLAKYAKP